MTSLSCLALLALAGCGGGGGTGATGAPDSTLRLEVRVVSDTGRTMTLDVSAPLSVWMARVSPSAPPEPATLPVPPPPPGLPEGEPPEPPRLVVDPGLKPPILRRGAVLAMPPGRPRESRTVELDVRVAEDGAVSDARWAGGAVDSALVAAAVESALGMRFYPALRAGRPVAVWCRQRFDFGP